VAGNDSFLDHLPALLAAAIGAAGASVGLSYFGVAGTLIGLVAGTLITGALAWWAERLIRRASARAKALAEARKRKGAPLSEGETALIARVTDAQHKHRYRLPWQAAALGAACVLALASVIVLVIALSAGRPVAAIVRGPARTAPPSHAVTTPPASPAPTTAASSASSTPPPSPSPSPSPSASITTSSPSPSPSASTTTAVPPTVPATVPAASASSP
jgi:hypothetical protein